MKKIFKKKKLFIPILSGLILLTAVFFYVNDIYHSDVDVQEYGSDIIGLNQKEPNSKGDAEFSPVLILSLGGIECKERKMPIWNRASQIRKLN